MICVTINPSPHIIGQPPAPKLNVAYNKQMSVAGGLAPFTWTLDGSLPPGISFGGGAFYGTTTTPGPYSYTVTVIDANAVQDALTVNWFVVPPDVVLTAAPGAATVNVAYSYTFTATGGIAPLTFSYTGTIPPGMTLNATTGVLSGTSPTVGNYSFAVTAGDAYGYSDTKNVTVAVATAPATIGGALANGYRTAAYSSSLPISGGFTPYSNPRVISGAAPGGLSLSISGSNLVLSGTPTAFGTFSFTVAIDDAHAVTATKAVTMQVYDVIAISGSAPPGYTQSPYSWTPTVTGGWGGNTFAIASGAVPAGTTLNTSTGAVTGTPTTVATYTFAIRVTDSHGNQATTATQTVSVTVGVVVSGTPPQYEQTKSQSWTPTATGGTGSYTWSVVAGALPGGLSINASTGQISGTPSASGTFSATIQAKDTNNVVGSTAFTFNVANVVRITKDGNSSVSGVINQNYRFAVNVSGGVPPYTYSQSGTRPAGTNFNASTGLINGSITSNNGPSFAVTVTDSLGVTATTAVQAPTIYSAMSISDNGWNTSVSGVYLYTFNTTFTASSGAGNYTYSYSGSIPNGTTLNASTGKLSGSCSKSGQYTFNVVATDKDGHLVQKQYTVNVAII